MRTPFNDLPTTKKGDIGERLFTEYLSQNGFVVYSPPLAGRHPVDRIVYHPKRGWLAVDVKTYPRRYCCLDTGIDQADYLKYQKLPLRVLLCFVDEFEGCIYVAYLDELKPTGEPSGGKVYFPLGAFKKVRPLTPAELAELDELSPYAKGERYRHQRRYFAAPKPA